MLIDVDGTLVDSTPALADCFTAIVGAADRPYSTKTTIVRDLHTRLRAKRSDVSRPVLESDRPHDVEGTRANDSVVVGALWGCAKPGKLDDADFLSATPAELRALWLPYPNRGEGTCTPTSVSAPSL